MNTYGICTPRITITIRSLRNMDRKIQAIRALRAIAKHVGQEVSLSEAKRAVDSLEVGVGIIKIRVDEDDEALVRTLLDLAGLSESETLSPNVLTIG